MRNIMENLSKVMNISSHLSEDYTTKLDFFDFVFIFLLIVIFLVGITGNLLVFYVFMYRQSKSLSTTETLICYLAFADLLASIVNPIMFSYWILTGHRLWHFGYTACVILPALTRSTVSFSFGIILIIAIDRYRVICHPSIRQMKGSHCLIAVLIALCISIMLEIPKMVYAAVKTSGNCEVEDQNNKNYLYPRIMLLITRDMTFLVTFSVTIYFINKELFLKERASTLKGQTDNKKMKNVIAILISMATIFFILVFPRDIFHVIYEISYLLPPVIKETKTIQHVNLVLKVFHLCNSISNPFIYAKLHTQFRQNIFRIGKRLLFGSRRKCFSQPNDESMLICEMKEDGENSQLIHPRFSFTRYKNCVSMMHEYYERETRL